MTESGFRLFAVMVGLRVWDRVEWMVSHSDHKYCLQRMLLVICYFLNLSDEESVTVSAFCL